jgi:hypothetical protein
MDSSPARVLGTRVPLVCAETLKGESWGTFEDCEIHIWAGAPGAQDVPTGMIDNWVGRLRVEARMDAPEFEEILVLGGSACPPPGSWRTAAESLLRHKAIHHQRRLGW